MAESQTQCFARWHESPRAGRLAIVTLDNGAGRRPNILGSGSLASLDEVLAAVERSADCRGLLITGKSTSFAAGADLQEFVGVSPAAAREAARRGQRAFARLRALRVPTVAAINGACLGGGLELALHCDARVVAGDATAIAFPEVALSIVPAWGGTQLAPRLLGAANALALIVHNPLHDNRLVTPTQAFALGLVDLVAEPADLHDVSLRHLEALVLGELPQRRTPLVGDDLDAALASARSASDGRNDGSGRAARRAVDLIEHAARGGDLAAGLALEQDAFADLLPAPQAQAALRAFLARRSSSGRD